MKLNILFCIVFLLFITACTIDCDKEENVDLCWKEQAIKTNNIELCNNIQLEELNKTYPLPKIRDKCFIHFAVMESDISICNNSYNWVDFNQDYKGKDFCRRAVLSNISQAAFKMGKPELCYMIGELNNVIWCMTEYARQSQDPEACNLITDSRKKDICINQTNRS